MSKKANLKAKKDNKRKSRNSKKTLRNIQLSIYGHSLYKLFRKKYR